MNINLWWWAKHVLEPLGLTWWAMYWTDEEDLKKYEWNREFPYKLGIVRMKDFIK